MNCTTPVALIIFNRPATTQRAFDALARVQPRRLLVVADGPRDDKPQEDQLCAAARAVVEQIDWDCDVQRDYSPTNLGCRRRVVSGLDWVFEHVEEAIILEDDCVPDPTFFPYCDELLQRYRNDMRVTMISGNNLQRDDMGRGYSYYFARSVHCWGWATWRRAWSHYDDEMTTWPEIRDHGWLGSLLGDSAATRYWTRLLDAVYARKLDTWDFTWALSCWLQNGLTVYPHRNLVTNVGFGPDATHTKFDTTAASRAALPLEFPLRHPPFVICNGDADRYTQSTQFVSRAKHLLGLIRSWLPKQRRSQAG